MSVTHLRTQVPRLVPGSDEHRLDRSVSASACACLVGQHPFLTVEHYAAMKRGEVEWEEENERMRFGHKAEQWVADAWEEEHGIALVKPESSYRCGPLTANPDRLVVGAPHVLVECKATGGSEGPVKPYWWHQIQAQFACTGATEGYLSVLWGSDLAIRHYPIGRDEEAITRLIEAAEQFLACLDLGVEPEVVGRDAEPERLVEVGAHEADLCRDLLFYAEAERDAASKRKALRSQLDALVGGPGMVAGERLVLAHEGERLVRVRRRRGRPQMAPTGENGDDYTVIEKAK